MIHIYTGNGKGKTTASFGLAMRASGHGLKSIIFQFFKPEGLISGEEISANRLKNIKVKKCKEGHPMFKSSCGGKVLIKRVKKAIKEMMEDVKKSILSKGYDIVILDEIINVLDQNFYSKKEFIKILKDAPSSVDIILTGRGDISMLENYADYITIMVDKKHPFRSGVVAKKGIEY